MYYIKQLLPFTYISEFGDNDGKHLCVWKMWFGKPYDIKYYDLR